MAKLTLKCRKHEASNCLRGCRKPSRGTRLTRISDYGYFDPNNVLTTHFIGELYEGLVETETEIYAYQTDPDAFAAPSSYDSSYGGGSSYGDSSSSDSGSSSSDSGSW